LAGVDDTRELVRLIVEECWADAAGLDRMYEHVADSYVHHSPFGDWDFAQFRRGLEWVDSRIANRTYRAQQIVVEGDRAAAFILWSGSGRADGLPVEGRGAYHCRTRDGRIQEDWDIFSPGG